MTDMFLTMQLAASRQKDIFYEMGNSLKKDGLITNVEQFVAEVEQREQYGSTYIGHGVAVPHYQTDRVARSFIVVGVCHNVVDWPTADHVPIQIVLLFVINMNGHTNQIRNNKMRNLMIHLASGQNLDDLVRLTDKQGILNRLMETPS
ncbi:MAG: PTS sugar transporter subunit IIA [Sporolactobacillus sp.]|jgi:mannitol/fructose-specific phosphotransferase system IIA component (Ntr-type)|nr:PTS sugar transporter subunit IIA [Sporolactobacillus sp.]